MVFKGGLRYKEPSRFYFVPYITSRFFISLLYGAHECQETNLQSAAIGTRVVFSPGKFVMQAGKAKKRVKLVIKGTTTWFYEERRRHLKPEKHWI